MRWTILEAGQRRSLDLEGESLTVGRAPDNQIQVRDHKVSRHHTRLERVPGGVRLVDLGSSNGTRVRGAAVQEAMIRPGESFSVGAVELVLESLEAVGEEPNATLTETPADRDELRTFARLTAALAGSVDLAALLPRIVDSAIDLAGAERGFLLLRSPDAPKSERPVTPEQLEVRVARTFEPADIVVPRTRLSAGVVASVVRDKRPLLSVDAVEDERLATMASVEELRLRSVLCVPVQGGQGLLGVLYLDNRLQRAAFDERDLELVGLFASQAAAALHNAGLVDELRRRAERLEVSRLAIQRLNEQLGRKVKDREGELAVARAQLGRARGREEFGDLIGASSAMQRVFEQLERIVGAELPVLIQGESGTGKELVARAIHRGGARKDLPFVSENCAALPDTLLESELFGHVKGAFTGAYRAKRGLLEQADGGTLFLDEVGDMSSAMQSKLLRVLQEGEVRPVGANEAVQVNVRVLAASHQDLGKLVAEGRFREDLFYRLAVLRLDLPPLRERAEDVPLLAEALLHRAAREAGKPCPALPHEVMSALVKHSWPGNVRELENEMRRLVVLGGEIPRVGDLSPGVLEPNELPAAPAEVLQSGDIKGAVADLERRAIEAALEQAGGNKSKAARSLGISRFALQRKLDKFAGD